MIRVMLVLILAVQLQASEPVRVSVNDWEQNEIAAYQAVTDNANATIAASTPRSRLTEFLGLGLGAITLILGGGLGGNALVRRLRLLKTLVQAIQQIRREADGKIWGRNEIDPVLTEYVARCPGGKDLVSKMKKQLNLEDDFDATRRS